MRRAIIEHQIEHQRDLPLHRLVMPVQQLQIAHEPGGVLRRVHQFHARASQRFDAARTP